jgi:glycosyltransferase involved in cell wall biosynthesis
MADIVAPAVDPTTWSNTAGNQTDAIGILAQPGNAAALVQAVRLLVARPQLAECIGANARRRVLESHTWKHHVTQTIDALQQRLDRPKVSQLLGR